MKRTRRELLAAIGTTASLGIAGCSDDGEQGTGTALTTTGTDRVPVTTPSTTAPETSQPTTAAPEATQTETTCPGRPSYVDPDAFVERSVTLNATEDCDLGATLALPTGNETVPGVVIVHGSGPQDRNGTVGPVQPYRDLAHGLASRGVVVLRYDKRTFACQSTIEPTEFTVDDVVTDDALTAVDRLREHSRVAADSVVVVGHSLGGALAPRIAGRDGDLAGIAMLAANARPLPSLFVDQTRFALARDGELTEDERAQLQDVRDLAERLRTVDIGQEEVLAGGGRPFWRSLAEYDQVETARGLDTPILLAQGLRDRQVPPETELERWREALGGRESVRIRTYEGLNHFFVDGAGPLETGGLPEDGVVSGSVVADLARWVRTVAAET